jgi:hypothetical protein
MTPCAQSVLLSYAVRYGQCFPSQARIAYLCCITERTVRARERERQTPGGGTAQDLRRKPRLGRAFNMPASPREALGASLSRLAAPDGGDRRKPLSCSPVRRAKHKYVNASQ